MNIHEHVLEGNNILGLGQLQITVGSHRLRTRHLDYEPRRRLDNGTLVSIEIPTINASAFENLYNDTSKWPKYLAVLELYWTNRSYFSDNVVSSRHQVPTTDLNILREMMELEETYGLRDAGENFPAIPIKDNHHLEYNLFLHKLESPPELAEDPSMPGLWHLSKTSDIMASIKGMTGQYNYTQTPHFVVTPGESRKALPFFDTLNQVFIANATGTPNLRVIADQAMSIALPLEVVYLNPTIGYNPCNSSGTPPYRLPPCDTATPVVNGHNLRHRSSGDMLRFPVLKPTISSASSELQSSDEEQNHTHTHTHTSQSSDEELKGIAIAALVISTVTLFVVGFFSFRQTEGQYTRMIS